MSGVPGRYDLFGWDYEAFNTLTDAEAAWHEMWARRTGGPLLGLACGTGRLLCRLARAGFDVVGLDLSDAMLALARKNISMLPPEAGRRITLMRRDMSDFDLGGKFGLVFIADNSFRAVGTRRGMLSCLWCVRRHLAPGGKVLITERRFDPSQYAGARQVSRWSTPRPHPETGYLVSRKVEVSLSRDRRRITGKMVYRIAHSDGAESIKEFAFGVPAMTTEEYVDLFGRAGFETRVFAGYSEMPDDGSSPLLCFALDVRPSCRA